MPPAERSAPAGPFAFTHGLSAPLKGALWMSTAAVGFAVMNAIIHRLATEVPALELAFFRNVFSLFFMLPWVARYARLCLSSGHVKLYSLRALTACVSMLCWFTAVALLPLAEAIALSFTGPLFATAGAALVLREHVGWRRWTAVAVGFLGVLIIVRPGAVALSLGTILCLCSAVTMAMGVLMVKTLARTEPAPAIVAFLAFYLAPMSLPPALLVWTWPSLSVYPYLVVLGLFGALAHVCYTRALAAADASLVVTFDYLRLPFSAAIAYVWFAEVPTMWTWLGAGVIAAATSYIAQRELVVRGAAARRMDMAPTGIIPR